MQSTVPLDRIATVDGARARGAEPAGPMRLSVALARLLPFPAAWLLNRGYWWAPVFVLVTPVLIVGQLPPWIYPAAFWACLVAVVAVGARIGDTLSRDQGDLVVAG